MLIDSDRIRAAGTNAFVAIFRLPVLNTTAIYSLKGSAWLQPLWSTLARSRAVAASRLAQRRCPAYQQFLRAHQSDRQITRSNFASLPETNKPNYVKAYSIEDRCYDGRIPSCGIVIDESSGSSGTPNNWVRGPRERAGVRRLLGHGFSMRFLNRQMFLINCFALGPWATGMNVAMSMADKTIVKSVGPDKIKLENTLKVFGSRYEYVIAGYPPFIKDFLDTTTLNLSEYTLHLLVGGEGMSEGLRDKFSNSFQSVYSSYGASDLEINLAGESPLSIAVRRLCREKPALSRDLFGRAEPPMLFQYDPLDYLIETNRDGELLFTLLRPGYTSPKIRYNIKDMGGTFSYEHLLSTLRRHGVRIEELPKGLAFPFLFVGARTDLTVAFYGAKVYTTDIEAVIGSESEFRDDIHSFQMRVEHDFNHNETLHIALEAARTRDQLPDVAVHRGIFFKALCRVNQDFQEVSKMFSEDRLVLEVYRFGSGPFASRDIRVKNKYVGEQA